MKAAVVRSFDHPPRYEAFDEPAPSEGKVVVEVLAVALSQLARGQASGRHYSSGKPPLVPGFDGVGRLPDGRRVYFAGPVVPFGAMAERTLVREHATLAIPDAIDDATAAAIANPGMSSAAALLSRAKLQRGETVLVLGATGVSGRLAVPLAKHLGAGRVVAAGRHPDVLRATGAEAILPLDASDEAYAQTVAEVDVVLDYLWGPPAERLLHALAGTGSADGERRVRYVQVGSIAGATIPLPAHVLRSSGLELLGSGLGSVSREDLLAAIARVFEAIVSDGLTIDTETVSLSEVEAVWNRDAGGKRVVFHP